MAVIECPPQRVVHIDGLCIQTGVTVTLGFFDDIVIPPEALQHPYRFDENEQVWVEID